MSPVDAFNLFEVYLWSIMGIGFLLAAIRKPANRWPAAATGIMLILFGISDWIELSTGAWWKPWWLFVWKAVCVISLAALGFVAFQRHTAAVTNTPTNNIQSADTKS